MADGLLPLNPATLPGGQVEDVEDLLGAGGAAVIRQRLQVTGALLIEIARVMDVDPSGTEYGLVTRNIAPRAAVAPTIARVPAAAANTALLAPNAARRGAMIFNDSISASLYVKLGAVASLIDFTVRLAPGGYYELPNPVWVGEIDGIWDDAVGAAQTTEVV